MNLVKNKGKRKLNYSKKIKFHIYLTFFDILKNKLNFLYIIK